MIKNENVWSFSWCVAVIRDGWKLVLFRSFDPCEGCWHQRILMYPLTILIGISIVKKDYKMSLYTAILSFLGMLFSLYHYTIQKIPMLSEHVPGGSRVPCTGELDFITIQFLALVAFILIYITSIITYKLSKEFNR